MAEGYVVFRVSVIFYLETKLINVEIVSTLMCEHN